MLAMVTRPSVTMQQIQVTNMSHSLHPFIYVMSHGAEVCRLVYETSEALCLGQEVFVRLMLLQTRFCICVCMHACVCVCVCFVFTNSPASLIRAGYN